MSKKRPLRGRVNRKRQAEGALVPRLLALVLSVGALLALSYLWLCGRCETLARDIKTIEVRYDEVHRRRLNEEYKWSNLCTLRRVQAALGRFHLEMGWPRQDRVVHLSRPLQMHDPEPEVPRGLQYARRETGERHD